MRSFLNIAGYELKKILKRRGSVTALALLLLISAASPLMMLIGYYNAHGQVIESSYEAMKTDRENERALAGRPVDTELFTEMKEAYSRVTDYDKYRLDPEYQANARKYERVFELVNRVYYFGLEHINRFTSEDMQNFYTVRNRHMNGIISGANMSEESKQRMIELNDSIEQPFVMDYFGGYERYLSLMPGTGLFAALVAAICLAPLFSAEYSTRADQLLLSSKLGKRKLASAKLIVACAFCIVLALITAICTFTVSGLVYGFDGASAPAQLSNRLMPYPFTMGETALITTFVVTAALVLTGVLTAFLSSRFRSPFGVFALISVIVFVPVLFGVSSDNITLYTIMGMFPANMMNIANIFWYVPYELFGKPLIPYSFTIVFCLVLSAALLPPAARSFTKCRAG